MINALRLQLPQLHGDRDGAELEDDSIVNYDFYVHDEMYGAEPVAQSRLQESVVDTRFAPRWDGEIEVNNEVRVGLKTQQDIPNLRTSVAPQVQSILRAATDNEAVPKWGECHIAGANLYLTWSASTAGTTLLNSLTLELKGVAQLYRLGSIISGLARLGDGRVVSGALNDWTDKEKQAIVSLRRYAAAMEGLGLLAALKNGASEVDTAHIDKAMQVLEKQATATRKAFDDYCVAKDTRLRTQWGDFRDSPVGYVTSGNSVLQFTSNILKSDGATLVNSAKTLTETVPFISGTLSIVSGVLNLVQGLMETTHATHDKETLKQASQQDKKVFGKYGHDCPELAQLIECRSDLRKLCRDKAFYQKVHGSVRSAYGTVGMSVGVASIALATLVAGTVSSVTMGIPLIVGGLALALYLGWGCWKNHKVQQAVKRYEKSLKAITSMDGTTRKSLPGLPDPARPSLLDIAAKFAASLADPDKKATAREALIALGISPTVIDSATRDNGVQLAAHLLPSRGITMTDEDLLRKTYARKDATAREKLVAVSAFMDLKEGGKPKFQVVQIEAEPEKPGESWTNRLRPRKNIADVRAMPLKRAEFDKFWDEKDFRSFFCRSLKIDNESEPQYSHQAWRILQDQRHKIRTKEEARVIVSGYVNQMKPDSIEKALRSKDSDPLALACRKLITTEYGIPADAKAKEIRRLLFAKFADATPDLSTIDSYIAISKTASAEENRKIAESAGRLLDSILEEMPQNEADKLKKALTGFVGIRQVSAQLIRNPHKVLEGLRQFLQVSEKLHGQNVAKIVASLEGYPTGFAFYKVYARLAALREMRHRFEEAVLRADPDLARAMKADFDSMMVLIDAQSGQTMYTRGIGAGDGSSVLGFFGYKLTDNGHLIQELFERCLSGKSSTFGFSGKALEALKDKSRNSTPVRDALIHWRSKLLSSPSDQSLHDETIDGMLALRSPGLMEKAIRSTDKLQQGHAKKLLALKLEASRLSLEAGCRDFHDDQDVKFDAMAFTAQLADYFALEKLSPPDSPTINVGPTLRTRLEFFRAALTWPNKAALAKNLRAVQQDLGYLRTGTKLPANAFWSTTFLESQGEAGKAEMTKFKEIYRPDDTLSYKKRGTELQKINNLSGSDLVAAMMNRTTTAAEWIDRLYADRGMDLKPQDRAQLLESLGEVAKLGEPKLYEALANDLESKMDARLQQEPKMPVPA